MLNSQPQGGLGAGPTTAAPSNPFAALGTTPAANPFASPASNPFLQNNTSSNQTNGVNPFTAAPFTSTANPFSNTTLPASKRSASPSTSNSTPASTKITNRFGTPNVDSGANSTPPHKPQAPVFGGLSTLHTNDGTNEHKADFVQPAWPKPSTSTTQPTGPSALSKPNNFGPSTTRNSSASKAQGFGQGSGIAKIAQLAASKKTEQNHNGRAFELADNIKKQLAKDRLTPPRWPTNPGSVSQRKEMESFRASYKAYYDKVRQSLIRAKLVDDPDVRRSLDEALDFRGISEDMCPEWERITRIVEFDIRAPEKHEDDSGELVVVPSLMVKRLARSAAGMDAPLPMDVRSFPTLRKTLDYLIDDLIPYDDRLPSKHGFLWDRTRAIRIDLSVQRYNLTTDERDDLVYCLETIARFHVTSLHLLSKKGVASEDFSEQQEIEQLGKTLMSLKELYDDCVEQGIECPNEAEFRGYYVLFNAHSPSTKETVEGWGERLWNSNEVRTAMCLAESIQNTWALQGPLNPHAPTDLALNAAAIFFTMVSSPEISYTMACFAEIHFNSVRKSMLQTIKKSYSRPKGEGPKDITPKFLRDRLRFDSEEEAVEFAEQLGMKFAVDDTNKYLVLNPRQRLGDARIRHAFSESLVECKRSGHPLPDIIRTTVYQAIQDVPDANHEEEESLFVSDADNAVAEVIDNQVPESDTESLNASRPATPLVRTESKPTDTSTTISPTPSATKSKSAPISDQPELPNGTSAASIFNQPKFTSPSLTAPAAPIGHFSSPFGKTQDSPSSTLSGDASRPSNNFLFNANSSPSGPAGGRDETSKSTNATANDTGSKQPFSFLNQGSADSSKATQGQSSLAPNNAVSSPSPAGFPLSHEGTPSHAPEASTMPPSSSGYHPLGKSPLFNQAQHMATPTTSETSFVNQTQSLSPSQLAPKATIGAQSPVGKVSSPKTTPLPRTMSTTLEQPTNITSPLGIKPASVATISKRDPMADFTRWFVLGDHGLLQDHLEEFLLEHFLRDTWEGFCAAEANRIQDEENRKLEAKALAFRTESLQIRYFYRWVDTFRKRRVVKRIQMEKEKARKWRSAESVAERKAAEAAKKEKAIKEARVLFEMRTKERVDGAQRLRDSTLRESTRSSDSVEEALLSTGVLRGVRDERGAARYASQVNHDGPEDTMPPGTKLRLRSENQRRRTRGLPPLKRFPEAPPVVKEGSKTAKLRALVNGAGRDSLSLSTGSLRNSTFSSSYRSSLGYNRGRVSKPRSGMTDPYWRMKANGLVQMPNGDYLHESLALPMLHEGKRFPGLGNYGLPDEEPRTPRESPLVIRESTSPVRGATGPERGASESPSVIDDVRTNRKRAQPDDDDLAAYRSEAPASRKRAKSGDLVASTPEPGPDDSFLSDIDLLLKRVEATRTASQNTGL